MHLKRNVGATKAPLSSLPPTTPPPIPTKPMDVSAPVAAPSTPPKPSEEKASAFANVSFGKSPKLAALEASGSNDYVLVSSPTVHVPRQWIPFLNFFFFFNNVFLFNFCNFFFARLVHSGGTEQWKERSNVPSVKRCLCFTLVLSVYSIVLYSTTFIIVS